MTQVEDLTAAPVTVRLDGRTYQMGPVTEGDVGYFQRFVRVEMMRTARESLPADATDEQRRMTEDVALRRAMLVTLDSPEAVLLLNTTEGLAHLVWRGVLKHHPDVPYEAVLAALEDERARSEIVETWNLLNAPGATDVKKKGTQRPWLPVRIVVACIRGLLRCTAGRRTSSAA